MTARGEQRDALRRVTGETDWPRIEAEVRRALREVRFGSIEIVIHDARVVQIERREKTRLAGV